MSSAGSRWLLSIRSHRLGAPFINRAKRLRQILCRFHLAADWIGKRGRPCQLRGAKGGRGGLRFGRDRQLRTRAAKRRVHSLFRQGCLLYELMPNMPEPRLRPLIQRYQEFLSQNARFFQALGFV